MAGVNIHSSNTEPYPLNQSGIDLNIKILWECEKEGDQMVSRYIRYDNIIGREVRSYTRDINLAYYFIITFF